MTVLQVLLLLVAIVALISGAVILTPIGIIIAAFAIYVWNALYPLLLRIGRWSAQGRNFLPFLILAIIIGVAIFVVALLTYTIFGFSGFSLLLFIWLFFLWLALLAAAALPIGLAIVVWVVRGVRWLWPRYRGSFWRAAPLVGGGMLETSKRLESQAGQARGYADSLELNKRLQEMNKLLEGRAAAARGLAEKAGKTSKASIIDPLWRLFRRK